MRRTWSSLALLLVCACGDDGGGTGDVDAMAIDAPGAPDAVVDASGPDANTLMPEYLRDTGLYADFERETLAPGVRAYAPQFQLWSDSATKRRWVYLPDGAQIDTSDMDFWVYPEGTKLWKEFTRDGVRIETRLLYKNGPTSQDWFRVAYVWNEAQTEAVATPGGVIDALGTDHDVPARNDCDKCHDRMPDTLIGFSAIQLDHDAALYSLDDLVTDGRLSDPPTGGAPYFDVPGDATERAALGYLHGNCGNCHHELSDVMDKVDVELRLLTDSLQGVTETRTYLTTVGKPNMRSVPGATALIEPGDPAASAVHIRMGLRDNFGMPPVGSEDPDATGLTAVGDWITSLAP